MPEIQWNPVDAADVKCGNRVAPLASWTLDVITVDADGTWVARNHDTGRLMVVPHPEQFRNLHRLEVDGVPSIIPLEGHGVGFDPLADQR